MREIRPSSLEGGVRLIPHPYPYQSPVPTTFEECGMRTFGFARLLSGAAWRARYQ